MKRTMLIFGMLMVLLTSGIGNVMAQEKLGGHFKLGRQSKDCKGLGLCGFWVEAFGFKVEWGTVDKSIGAIAMQTSVDENKNTFTLSFSIGELKRKDAGKAAELDRERFILDEDIRLSADANKIYKLKRTTPIVLKAGSYPIRKNGDTAEVVINIK